MTALIVMVLGSEPNAAAHAALKLGQADHNVLSCHDPGRAPFPWRGFTQPSTCPLRSHPVDIALVVRSGTGTQPTVNEGGARCARVHRVVAGTHVLDPYNDFASRTIDATDDIVDACEHAATAPIDTLGQRATAALTAVVSATETDDPPLRAEVTRRAGRMDVHVMHDQATTNKERPQAAVRIAMAVRELDPFAAGIDIAIDDADERPP